MGRDAILWNCEVLEIHPVPLSTTIQTTSSALKKKQFANIIRDLSLCKNLYQQQVRNGDGF